MLLLNRKRWRIGDQVVGFTRDRWSDGSLHCISPIQFPPFKETPGKEGPHKGPGHYLLSVNLRYHRWSDSGPPLDYPCRSSAS